MFGQRMIRSEDLFFFLENALILGEIRDEIEVKTFFFFFGEHLDFGRKIGKLEMKSK